MVFDFLSYLFLQIYHSNSTDEAFLIPQRTINCEFIKSGILYYHLLYIYKYIFVKQMLKVFIVTIQPNWFFCGIVKHFFLKS